MSKVQYLLYTIIMMLSLLVNSCTRKDYENHESKEENTENSDISFESAEIDDNTSDDEIYASDASMEDYSSDVSLPFVPFD